MASKGMWQIKKGSNKNVMTGRECNLRQSIRLCHSLEVRLCEHALTPVSALMGTLAISLQTAEVAAAQQALCLKYFAARLGVKRAAELKGIFSLSDTDVLCWDPYLQRDDGRMACAVCKAGHACVVCMHAIIGRSLYLYTCILTYTRVCDALMSKAIRCPMITKVVNYCITSEASS